ncbi:MAG TPA: ankyrin repeat domain-containing protein [Stellaceae bacterium]|jgi:ankyrin repeat protein|nr:ankyrin repeat domain-containing protein [Stellaceae bacterium]
MTGSATRRTLLIGIAVLFAARRSWAQLDSFGAELYTVAQAARHDKTEDVILLLQQGKRPDTVDGTGQTALGYAAQFGDTQMAQALLHYNAPVDAKDQFGNTPMHWAAQRGATEIIQMLVDAKATVDAANQQGVTPLMMAANAGQVQSVRLLLKSGADPHRGDFTGRDAIGWADGKPAVLQFLRAAK